MAVRVVLVSNLPFPVQLHIMEVVAEGAVIIPLLADWGVGVSRVLLVVIRTVVRQRQIPVAVVAAQPEEIAALAVQVL